MYQVPMPPNRPTPKKSNILLVGLVILLLHKLTKKK